MWSYTQILAHICVSAYCNKIPQTEWFTVMEIYSLTDLRSRSWTPMCDHSSHSLKALGERPLLSSAGFYQSLAFLALHWHSLLQCLPPLSHSLLSSVCRCGFKIPIPYKDISNTSIGNILIQLNLILTWLCLEDPLSKCGFIQRFQVDVA